MPAPLLAKIDRIASPAGDPPGRFLDAVGTVPGLEAVHLLRSLDDAQHAVSIWLWRGREGMQAGHDALAKNFASPDETVHSRARCHEPDP